MRHSGPNIVHLSGCQATAGGFIACHDASRRPQSSVPPPDSLPLRSASPGGRRRSDTQASTALDLLQPVYGPRRFCGGAPNSLPFQCPLPRRTRHGRAFQVVEQLPVSIHAPARGATVALDHRQLGGLVSIHAPARGATAGGMSSALGFTSFQSTRPRGARHLLTETSPFNRARFQSTRPRGARQSVHPHDGAEYEVSIHAPARGATG